MKLDRRQFFKTIAAGAVAVSLPAVAVVSDITPKTEPSKQDRQKFAKFFKAVATRNPTDIQACKDEGIEMKQVTDGGFWANAFEHQKMCRETMSDEMIKDIITDLEGNIKG